MTPAERAALVAAAKRRHAASTVARRIDRPHSLTPLVGREQEIRRVGALLRNVDVRLVTLTGPGGIGKTRLAMQVAAEVEDAFPGGVRVVSMAALRDAALVPRAIAHAIGLQEGDRPLSEALAQVLRGQRPLLVLDNFEGVVDAAPRVTELLARCPGVKALVTSRATLHVTGEHDLPVAPLAVPGPAFAGPLDAWAAFPTLQLFAARATAARPDFALTAENAATVADICRRLDGLPLAIELVAARSDVLSPRALLARLDRRLPLLTDGPRDVPVRLRTMRDAIAWSYDLLPLAAQALFRLVSVFAGGFTLDAAEWVMGDGAWVMGDDRDPVAPITHAPSPITLDAMSALLRQSLLWREEQSGGEPRFAMLETIREYGLEQLAAHGEEGAARGAHAAYYQRLAMGMVTSAEDASAALAGIVWDAALGRYRQGGTRLPLIWGPEQGHLLDLLEREHDNLREMLAWTDAHGTADASLGLCWALWWFWQTRGYLTEGRHWMERALNRNAGDPALHALVLFLAGVLAWMQGDDTRAVELQEHLARAAQVGSSLDRARALLLDAILAWRKGDAARMEVAAAEALPLFQAWPEPMGAAISLIIVATTARGRGDSEHTTALLAGAEASCRDIGFVWGQSSALTLMGEVARDRADTHRAAALFAEGLALFHAQRDLWGTGVALAGLGTVAGLRGDSQTALRLLAAAAARFETVGTALPPVDTVAFDRTLAALRTELGTDAFAATWAAGRALPPAAAVEEALAMASRLADTRKRGEHAPEECARQP